MEFLLEEVRELRSHTLRALNAAERSRNMPAVVSLTREARAIYQLLSDLSERVLARKRAEPEPEPAPVNLSRLSPEELNQLQTLLGKVDCGLPTPLEPGDLIRRKLFKKLVPECDEAEIHAGERQRYLVRATIDNLREAGNVTTTRRTLGVGDETVEEFARRAREILFGVSDEPGKAEGS